MRISQATESTLAASKHYGMQLTTTSIQGPLMVVLPHPNLAITHARASLREMCVKRPVDPPQCCLRSRPRSSHAHSSVSADRPGGNPLRLFCALEIQGIYSGIFSTNAVHESAKRRRADPFQSGKFLRQGTLGHTDRKSGRLCRKQAALKAAICRLASKQSAPACNFRSWFPNNPP